MAQKRVSSLRYTDLQVFFFAQSKHTNGTKLLLCKNYPFKGLVDLNSLLIINNVHVMLTSIVRRNFQLPTLLRFNRLWYWIRIILDLFGLSEEGGVPTTKAALKISGRRKLAARGS